MKRLVPIMLVLGFAVLLVAGCGGDVPTGAIAAVDGVPITKTQFDQYMAQAKVSSAAPGGSAFPRPGTTLYKQYEANAVTSLVQQQVELNAASARKITVSGQQVQAQLAQMAAQYGGVQVMYAAARRAGMNAAQLTTYIKDSSIEQMLYQRIITKSPPTVQQMKAYYGSHETLYDAKATRTVRHILVKTKAEALKVRALLVANGTDADWDKLAKRYSIDPGSKNSGGSLGAITRGQMVKPFDAVAFSLPLDTLSAPVHSSYGWHVIEVTAITPGKRTSFASAQADIKSTLDSQAWQDWLAKAQIAARIDYAPGYDPARLEAAPSPSPHMQSSPLASPK